jgi:hypothetical protein
MIARANLLLHGKSIAMNPPSSFFRKRASLIAALLGAASLGTASPAQQAATPTVIRAEAGRLTVDLSSDTGPYHGGASGTLYGLYDARLPFPNLIEGIGLRTVSTKAQDGPQHPGADALEVARLLTDASGGDTYIYMTDITRHFPYRWKTGDCAASVTSYIEKLRAQVEQVKTLAPRYRARIVFVPYNEPEGNMFGDGPESCDGTGWQKNPKVFFDAWDRAVRMIRTAIPGARIAGPNTSRLFDENLGFLRHVVAADTLPDVMTWHELSDPATVRASVGRYRGWEDQVFAGTPHGGKHLPININEYAYNYHTSVPGQMIQWIAAIEDVKVDADIAYWNIDGNLSDSAVQANRGNGQWWLLNRYAEMTGHTLAVTPPQPGQSYTLQGVATLDPAKKQARIILGGGSGANTLTLANIPAAMFGRDVRVLVREIGWSGQLGDAPPPRAVADLTMPVAAGSMDLAFGRGALPPLREESAYEVIVSPAGGGAAARDPILWRQDYEAEKAARHGTGLTIKGPEGSPKAVDRFYTSGGYSVAGYATDRDVRLDVAVDVPRDGFYDLRVIANSFNKDAAVAADGATNAFLRIDGATASERELLLPLGYKPSVWDHADTTVSLTRGRHVVTLATRSLDGTRRTVGNALIDRLTLSLPDPAATETVYEAEYASLAGATPTYGGLAKSGPGAVALPRGATATFWVYAPSEGLTSIGIDTVGRGSTSVTVNGIPLADGSAAFLMGGINKLVVSGATATMLDRIRVGKPATTGARVYEAEAATIAGSASIASASRATGGRAVIGIGGEPGNGNTLTFGDIVVDRPGRYALTIRYANDEQSQATHYNPDPLARRALISVNGGAAMPVTFPNSFHRNNWWELTIPVTLRAGRNSVRFAGEEQPNFDGRSYASQAWPGVLLRSRFAPDIDRIAITPLIAAQSTRRQPYASKRQQ